MRIVCHRGYWVDPAQKNSHQSFVDALERGFGIETDLRDAAGSLVISHDPPRSGEMPVADFLALCSAHPESRPLALNIKSDGLAPWVEAALRTSGVQDAFVFDMSVPDALGHLAAGLPLYTRISEFENPPAFADRAAGVWLDAFNSDWYSMAQLATWLDAFASVCMVSPELHRRDHLALWQRLKDAKLHQHAGLSLCTDFASQARIFFHD